MCISNSGLSAYLKHKTVNQRSVLSDSLVAWNPLLLIHETVGRNYEKVINLGKTPQWITKLLEWLFNMQFVCILKLKIIFLILWWRPPIGYLTETSCSRCIACRVWIDWLNSHISLFQRSSSWFEFGRRFQPQKLYIFKYQRHFLLVPTDINLHFIQ